MTYAGEGWRHDFGIVCLSLQIATIVASTVIITRCPQHRVLQGRDLNMAYVSVIAQICFLDDSLIEVWGEAFLPCAAFYWLHVLGPAIFIYPQISNGIRLLRLFEFNELKALVTAKQQLSKTQSERMKRLQHMMNPSFVMQRFVGILTAELVMLAVIYCVAGRPFITSNYGCRLTAPPWESQAAVMTDILLDPLYIAWIAMFLMYAVITVWVAVRLHAYHRQGVTESLGLLRELLVTYGGIGLMLSVATVVIYSSYSTYPTTYNWIQLPALTPMACCLHCMVLPVVLESALVKKLMRYVRSSQTVAPAATSLLGVLHDRLGFQYMLLQCRSEFNEENIVALKAIWQFAAKPSFTAMQDIYRCFIEDGAVLQLNISNAARDRVEQMVHSRFPGSPLDTMSDVFGEVEVEVMKLVENNCWVRFKQSTMYQRYLAGELPPNVTQSDIDCSAISKRSSFTPKARRSHELWDTPGRATRKLAPIGISMPEPPSITVTQPATRARPSSTTERYISIPASTTPSNLSPQVIVPTDGAFALRLLDVAAHSQLQADVDAFTRPQGNRTPHVNMNAHRRTTTGSPMLLNAALLAIAPARVHRSGTLPRSASSMPARAEPEWQAVTGDVSSDMLNSSQLEINVMTSNASTAVG